MPKKVPVSRRAAEARVRRHLLRGPLEEGEPWFLHKARSTRVAYSVGTWWYATNNRHCVVHKWDDLEEIVEWCNVLKPYEEIES